MAEEEYIQNENAGGATAPDWTSHIATLRSLVEIVRDAKLSELELEQGGVRLSLKSPAAVKRKLQIPLPVGDYPGALADAEVIDDATDDEPESAGTVEPGLVTVVSPMVGLFYRAPSPNDPNFVEVGDHVEIGQTLGLVETMKVFNEIASEIEGTVVSINFASTILVETGDVLMSIRKA